MALDDGSCLSHSANYIVKALECVSVLLPSQSGTHILTLLLGYQEHNIGPWNFCAATSDNTSNTKKAQRLLCEHYPHIINLQDACHLLNLAVKGICLLPEFEDVSGHHFCLECLLTVSLPLFSSHSSYTMEHYNHKQTDLGISQGLEAISNTCFGTIYWAALSIQHGLPAFQAVIKDTDLGIDIAVSAKLNFKLKLSKLLTIIWPWAKGTRCLEGAHVTPDQVYFIFLGILAQHEEDFCKNEFQLQNGTIRSIC
ncbi:hypothetical protein BDR05DRAFT_880881 [Suillus weaverae]|nr:hypothetical protein BDR05DRAFT_880881 [Suillus weaverae]